MGLYVKCRHSCRILIKLEFSPQILEKYSNIKFHENPSSGSRVVPLGRANGRTDMTMLTVAYRNFAKEPKSYNYPTNAIYFTPAIFS